MFNLKAWTMNRIENANVEASAYDIAQRLCDTINRKWRTRFSGVRYTLSVEKTGYAYERVVLHMANNGVRIPGTSKTWGYLNTKTADLYFARPSGERGAQRFDLRNAVGYTDALTYAADGHDFIARKQPAFAYAA